MRASHSCKWWNLERMLLRVTRERGWGSSSPIAAEDLVKRVGLHLQSSLKHYKELERVAELRRLRMDAISSYTHYTLVQIAKTASNWTKFTTLIANALTLSNLEREALCQVKAWTSAQFRGFSTLKPGYVTDETRLHYSRNP